MKRTLQWVATVFTIVALAGCAGAGAGDGNGDNPARVLPKVSTGSQYIMVLTGDRVLWTAGENDVGQLGDGTQVRRDTFTEVMANVVDISAGSRYAMVITSDRTLWAFGINDNGQQGIRGPRFSRTPYPTPRPVMDNVASVSAGRNHTMIVRTDGTIWGTGDGPRGDGPTVYASEPRRVPAPQRN